MHSKMDYSSSRSTVKTDVNLRLLTIKVIMNKHRITKQDKKTTGNDARDDNRALFQPPPPQKKTVETLNTIAYQTVPLVWFPHGFRMVNP